MPSNRQLQNRRRALLHLLLFPVVLIYLEFLLRLFTGTGVFRNISYPILFAISFGLFLGAITSLFPQKINFILTVILLIVITFYFGLESFIHSAFRNYMTLQNITTGTHGVATGFGSIVAKTLILGIPKIALFYLPTILYIWRGKNVMPAKRRHPVAVAFLLVCALVTGVIGIIAASHGSTKEKYAAQYNFDTATNTFGLLTSTRLEWKYRVFGNKKAEAFATLQEEEKTNFTPTPTPTEAPKIYDPNVMDIDFDAAIAEAKSDTVRDLLRYAKAQEPSLQNEYTGLFEGKNLILICAEAFSSAVISEELTPTLYRLTHNGFYFSNFYQPAWGGSTSTGEYSMLTGLVPMHGVDTVLETREKNNYFTPGNQLQRLGYASFAFHSGDYDYYERQTTHTNLGYDTWLGLGNGLEEITGEWPADDVFFERTMDLYLDKEPFSIYYMTISGHAPYVSDDYRTQDNIDRVRAVFGEDTYKQTTMNYLCYQLELEDALTVMVEKLEEVGIADDTVICMTSDHYPYGLEQTATWGNAEDYVLDLYKHEDETPWGQDQNTWLLWSGCLEHADKKMACEISAPTYSLDILPTLSNLFGWEYDSRLLVGRDVFSDQEPLVLWNGRSWMTERGRYNAETEEFIPEEGYEVDEDYVKRIQAIVGDKITFSQGVLNTDLYGILFGPDPDGT